MVAGVECARQGSLSFNLIEVGNFEQMRHLKSILIVEDVVECAIEVSCVVRELRHGLSTCQGLIYRHSARLQVVVLIGVLGS